MEETPKYGGKHSFTVLWRFNPEWYRLIGSRCKQCGTVHYPRKMVCVYPCTSHDMEETQLSHTGNIVYGGFAPRATGTGGYVDAQPQFFTTVKLDNGPHVMGELVNLPLDFVRRVIFNPREKETIYGKKVRMVLRRFRKHDNGDITYGHKFELLDTIGSQ